MTNVFVNRTINLRKISHLGFDMDHTLVLYDVGRFERLVHTLVKRQLVEQRGYHVELYDLPFERERFIRGLVIDKNAGDILKINRFGRIRKSYHGTREIDFRTQSKRHWSTYVDLNDANYLAMDTAFSVTVVSLAALLVDLHDARPSAGLPPYGTLVDDVVASVDQVHRDGTLKTAVREDLPSFIRRDPAVAVGLERYRHHGKKLFLVTNSHYDYTALLLDYTLNPSLSDYRDWRELFDLVVTGAGKPRFFSDDVPFLRVDPADGKMTHDPGGPLTGCYHGGSASQLQRRLGIQGEEILYVGDHIYGDILRLKKDCGWRTGLVIEELSEDLASTRRLLPTNERITALMLQKAPLEEALLELRTSAKDHRKTFERGTADKLSRSIAALDEEIGTLIVTYQQGFNRYWDELMRAGNEESFFAAQVERYACLYMPGVTDLLALSPRAYLRAPRRLLPHEM